MSFGLTTRLVPYENTTPCRIRRGRLRPSALELLRPRERHLERLMHVKKQYDHDDLFSFRQGPLFASAHLWGAGAV